MLSLQDGKFQILYCTYFMIQEQISKYYTFLRTGCRSPFSWFILNAIIKRVTNNRCTWCHPPSVWNPKLRNFQLITVLNSNGLRWVNTFEILKCSFSWYHDKISRRLSNRSEKSIMYLVSIQINLNLFHYS